VWFSSWRNVTPSAIGPTSASKLQRPRADELEDERGDERLRHAPDQEAVIEGQRRAGPRVGDTCRALPVCRGHDHARHAGLNDGLEVSLEHAAS
jgi:hypothetical protein